MNKILQIESPRHFVLATGETNRFRIRRACVRRTPARIECGRRFVEEPASTEPARPWFRIDPTFSVRRNVTSYRRTPARRAKTLAGIPRRVLRSSSDMVAVDLASRGAEFCHASRPFDLKGQTVFVFRHKDWSRGAGASPARGCRTATVCRIEVDLREQPRCSTVFAKTRPRGVFVRRESRGIVANTRCAVTSLRQSGH